MNVERLRLVIDAVREAPAEQFYMGAWDCGTSACAVGWYCRANPKAELRLVREGCRSRMVPYIHGRDSVADFDFMCPVADHFGITYEEANHLFDNLRYTDTADRLAVIARIEALLATEAPPPMMALDVKAEHEREPVTA